MCCKARTKMLKAMDSKKLCQCSEASISLKRCLVLYLSTVEACSTASIKLDNVTAARSLLLFLIIRTELKQQFMPETIIYYDVVGKLSSHICRQHHPQTHRFSGTSSLTSSLRDMRSCCMLPIGLCHRNLAFLM